MAIIIALFGGCLSPGAKDKNGADPGNQTAENLKLLQRYDNLPLPKYQAPDSKDLNIEFVNYEAGFSKGSIEGKITVDAARSIDVSTYVKAKNTKIQPTFLILVRMLDENGNCILCAVDSLTNESYNLKMDLSAGADEYYRKQKDWNEKARQATHWEALIYGK